MYVETEICKPNYLQVHIIMVETQQGGLEDKDSCPLLTTQ